MPVGRVCLPLCAWCPCVLVSGGACGTWWGRWGFKAYYLTATAFWLSGMFLLLIEKKKKDFWMMLLHHLVTVLMLAASWEIK